MFLFFLYFLTLRRDCYWSWSFGKISDLFLFLTLALTFSKRKEPEGSTHFISRAQWVRPFWEESWYLWLLFQSWTKEADWWMKIEFIILQFSLSNWAIHFDSFWSKLEVGCKRAVIHHFFQRLKNTEISFHEISFHEISFHEISFHKIFL